MKEHPDADVVLSKFLAYVAAFHEKPLICLNH